MKGLLVYTADADTQAVFHALLRRPNDLDIGPIAADVDRHFGRDAGMFATGPALCRHRKREYQYVLLVLDHHGSGREHNREPETIRANMLQRLRDHSWAERSDVVVIKPELEAWLWRDANAIAAHFGVETKVIMSWADRFGMPAGLARGERPKELLEFVVRDRLRRTISPADFEHIAERADLSLWLTDPTFEVAVTALRTWFPR